ncbi:Hypothetical predicted protein, partial [Scomber scombrus]
FRAGSGRGQGRAAAPPPQKKTEVMKGGASEETRGRMEVQERRSQREREWT